MARRRFFVDRVHRGQAEITGESAHHLTRVLRVEAGQMYEITDNERAWLARIESARKDLVRFEVIEELPAENDAIPVTLCLALIKFERFEWAVEKATELGVARVVPMESSRSEHGLFEGARKRVERWRRIAREASEQSRRLRAPEIADPVRFAAAIGDEAARRVWLDERPGAVPLIQVIQAPAPSALTPGASETISLSVGPEGGWTDAERTAFTEAGWTGASLGATILRAETAVCAALAVVSQVIVAQVIATMREED